MHDSLYFVLKRKTNHKVTILNEGQQISSICFIVYLYLYCRWGSRCQKELGSNLPIKSVTWFVVILIRHMLLVEQGLFILPKHLRSPLCFSEVVLFHIKFSVQCVCRTVFIFFVLSFSLVEPLHCLPFDYSFDIFKLSL